MYVSNAFASVFALSDILFFVFLAFSPFTLMLVGMVIQLIKPEPLISTFLFSFVLSS